MFFKKGSYRKRDFRFPIQNLLLRFSWPFWAFFVSVGNCELHAASDNRDVEGAMRGAPLAIDLQFTAR